MSERVGAIVVAAGASRRMGFDKLWAELGGHRVVEFALRTLAHCPEVHQVVLVVSEQRLSAARDLAATLDRPVQVCAGGRERRDSVAAGLRQLRGCDWVLVHDAARPFLTRELVQRGLEAARSTGAAVAGIPTRDTTKRVRDDLVVETIPRAQLRTVQTPQVFRADLLARALASSDSAVTDEATLVEQLGEPVRVFAGADQNWKITTPADLDLARAWLAYRGAL